MKTEGKTTEPIDSATMAKVKGLLVQIDSSSGVRRAVTEEQLRAMGPPAIHAIWSLLRPSLGAYHARRSRVKWLHRLFPAAAAGIVAAMVLAYTYQWSGLFAYGFWSVTMLLLTALGVRIVSHNMHPVGFAISTVEALVKIADPPSIPILLSVRPLVRGRDAYRQVGQAVIWLLPRIKLGDEAVVAALNRSLRSNAGWLDRADRDYAIAVLKGLEQIGDDASIPIVRRLAQSQSECPVREAARACLPHLEARAESASRVLLRASSPSEIQAAVLVRAASAGKNAEQDELLRASGGAGGNP